jgi:penicillin-binding protein 1A
VINDAPISFPASETGSQSWEPKNYDGTLRRVRCACARRSPSRRTWCRSASCRRSAYRYAQDYVTRFGFEAQAPAYLTMALGAGSVTPWQMVTAYAVFANGGYRIRPYVVREIQDDKKQVLARAEPITAGDETLRAIDPRNAYLMDSMLRDVTIYGTAARASATLKRRDLAGKTGTTNEHVDAWFCGYQQTVVGCSWIGFDQPRNLGSGETGGTAALPTWISYMAKVLKDVPESFLPAPEGVVAVASRGSGSSKGPTEELFYQENAPAELEPEPPVDPSIKPED